MYRMKVDWWWKWIDGWWNNCKIAKTTSQFIRFVMPRLTKNRPPPPTDARETLPIHWWWRRGGIYGHTMVLRTTKASHCDFASCRSLLKKLQVRSISPMTANSDSTTPNFGLQPITMCRREPSRRIWPHIYSRGWYECLKLGRSLIRKKVGRSLILLNSKLVGWFVVVHCM